MDGCEKAAVGHQFGIASSALALPPRPLLGRVFSSAPRASVCFVWRARGLKPSLLLDADFTQSQRQQ
eukprot:6212034-Pleurochrysis_carterae.AAC.4